MSEFLHIMVPLEAAMLCPIWMPLLGVALGILTDRIRGEQVTPVEEVVRAAKNRSELQRRETAGQLVGRRTRTLPVRDEQAGVSAAA